MGHTPLISSNNNWLMNVAAFLLLSCCPKLDLQAEFSVVAAGIWEVLWVCVSNLRTNTGNSLGIMETGGTQEWLRNPGKTEMVGNYNNS
jgi:hypothetical protein